MELLFVAMTGDVMAGVALTKLHELGYQTRLLQEGEVSPEDSVALFTPHNIVELGSRRRFLRCSVDKIRRITKIPVWLATNYMAAVLKTKKYRHKRFAQFSEDQDYLFVQSLRNLAESYRQWEPGSKEYIWACHRRRAKKTESVNYRTVRINAWDVNFSDDVRVFSDSAVEQGLALLARWQDTFTVENTWSRRELGTPSLVVRLDCVVHDGHLTVYEVEERPSGLGVSSMVNPFFKDQLREILKTWPDFRVVISSLRAGTDDHIWMQSLNRPIQSDAELVLVRAEPEETNFHHLGPQSVSSVIAKGDKSYGETLGLWQRIHSVKELSWDKGFVLKPKQGSKMHDVEIWDPYKRPGSTIKSRIEAAMLKHGSMFLQPLVDPMETGRSQFQWMIYRVFFGFDTKTRQWKCLGGNWNARSNLRIHGASDALFGPVILA